MKVEEISPYGNEGDKGKEVEQMFDSISRKYDLMNAAMSMGQFRRWRDKALKAAIKEWREKNESFIKDASQRSDLKTPKILDVATGTGDIAFRLNEMLPQSLITGIDLSEGMLEIARKKLSLLSQSQQEQIVFGKGDSLAMPFHDGDFNIVTVAYGVRNFSDLRKGLEEIRRVLSKTGVLCIIELSTPRNSIVKAAYNIYAGKFIPWMGKKVTGDNKAYSYLPESIEACPQREEMASLLYAAGFSRVTFHSLSFGALTYYLAL